MSAHTHVVQLRDLTTRSVRWYDTVWTGSRSECQARRLAIAAGDDRLLPYSRVRKLKP